MPSGCDEFPASSGSDARLPVFSHTRTSAVLDNSYAVDVSHTDSTISLSPEHGQHVPADSDLTFVEEIMSATLPAGQRRDDLRAGDARDVQAVAHHWVEQAGHPRRACLSDVAFDQGTGIEEVCRHPQRRSSMMVSDTGLPLTVTGW